MLEIIVKEYFSKDYIVEDAPISTYMFDLYLTKQEEWREVSLLRWGWGR